MQPAALSLHARGATRPENWLIDDGTLHVFGKPTPAGPALFRKTSAQKHGSLARFAISGAGAAATNQDSNFDSLFGIKSASDLRAGQHPFVAARNQFAVFHHYLAFFMVLSCHSFIIRRGDVWPRSGVAPGVAAGF